MKSAVFYGKHDEKQGLRNMKSLKSGRRRRWLRLRRAAYAARAIHIFEGDKGSVEGAPPAILGHEFSGIIVETGKDITNFKTGDRVCVDPNLLLEPVTPAAAASRITAGI